MSIIINTNYMKILHISQLIGGLDVYIRNTIIYSEANFEYVIVRGKNDEAKPIVKYGKTVTEYKIDLYRSISLLDFLGFFQILRIVRKEKPDIIHCHSSKGGLLGRIIGSLCGVRTFYTPHAFSFLSSGKKLNKQVYILIEKLTRFKTSILACSESEAKLAREVVKYKDNRVLVWQNSVPDASRIIDQSEIDIEIPYIVTVGRPSYQKNTLFLIHVAKKVVTKLPHIKFYIVGVGHYSPRLDLVTKYISDNGLQKNIFLIPWSSQEDTYRYILKAEFYLSVARYEGLPLAIIEAMSLSKPIIASKVAGNVDCVENGSNGYLLDLDDELFTNRIIELLEGDSIKVGFAKKSREMFEERFQIKNTIAKLEGIYKLGV